MHSIARLARLRLPPLHRHDSAVLQRMQSTVAAATAAPSIAPAPPPTAERNARAQKLCAIRSAATGPADSMDIWSMNSVKHRGWEAALRAGTPLNLNPITSLDSIVKRPRDSLLTVTLPFGSDAAFRAQYINWRGMIRIGKLLEEMDSFAGNVAYLHCDDGDPNTELPILVTASTDRVDLIKYPLNPDRDLQMRGCVTYAGATSMNIDIDFSTVPRNAGERSEPVRGLIPETGTMLVVECRRHTAGAVAKTCIPPRR